MVLYDLYIYLAGVSLGWGLSWLGSLLAGNQVASENASTGFSWEQSLVNRVPDSWIWLAQHSLNFFFLLQKSTLNCGQLGLTLVQHMWNRLPSLEHTL